MLCLVPAGEEHACMPAGKRFAKTHRVEEKPMTLIEHFSWFDAVILCAVAVVILLGMTGHDTAR